jgi:S-adenosylmethionine:tRNA ribosyltransferase-isomerase
MEPNIWETLVKPGRRVKQGTIVDFAETKDHSIFGEAMERTPAGGWVFCFHNEAALAEVGKMPLPPYIHHPLNNPERYQTIYASVEGSVAAPTAGLHFTPGLMGRLQAQGVRVAYVTLHIGLDTFRPVQVENPLEHPIHAEIGEVTSEVAEVVAAAKAEGRKVIAVGTTTVRLLESAAAERGTIQPYAGWTRLFITPGYRFKVVDTMITNFHLPRSTLLMLVSAFAGRQFVLKAYYEAVRQGYRFYSFGDATLIL